MTRRFFYTDPLAAAWMAKHFGMKLKCLHRENDDGVESEQAGTPYPFEHAMLSAEMWEDAITATCRRVYVHPDSLHLLEPQIDDVCMCRLHLDDLASEIAPFKIHVPNTKHDVVAIIQRNGIPFHWPESEEA